MWCETVGAHHHPEKSNVGQPPLPALPPYESISCDSHIFSAALLFLASLWTLSVPFPVVIIWTVFICRSAFQAALPSDTSTQQHTTFVCIPACVPLGQRSSEKPLTHIPGIPSFSLVSTLHQVSKFIALLCARFTFFPPLCLCSATACTASPDSSGSPGSYVPTGFFWYLFQGHSSKNKFCLLGG